jgi:hypothetical protein
MQEKFVVPQFIENEARVFGPVTVRQFLIVIMGGLLAFICYKLSDFTLFILQAILIILFFGTLAFVKINSMPFHFFLLNFTSSLKKPKVRIWIKEEIKIDYQKAKGEDIKEEVIKRKSLAPKKKISELSLIIDTGGAYRGELDANKENNVTYNK